MHNIVASFINNLTTKDFNERVAARVAARQAMIEMGASAELADTLTTPPTTQHQTIASEVAGPNRAARRFAAKNPKPGEKKKRLGGYGVMIQSYFDQKRGLARDEKKLAQQNARAAQAAAVGNNYQTA